MATKKVGAFPKSVLLYLLDAFQLAKEEEFNREIREREVNVQKVQVETTVQ